jgi:hypothetical protein
MAESGFAFLSGAGRHTRVRYRSITSPPATEFPRGAATRGWPSGRRLYDKPDNNKNRVSWSSTMVSNWRGASRDRELWRENCAWAMRHSLFSRVSVSGPVGTLSREGVGVVEEEVEPSVGRTRHCTALHCTALERALYTYSTPVLYRPADQSINQSINFFSLLSGGRKSRLVQFWAPPFEFPRGNSNVPRLSIGPPGGGF